MIILHIHHLKNITGNSDLQKKIAYVQTIREHSIMGSSTQMIYISIHSRNQISHAKEIVRNKIKIAKNMQL